MGFPLLGTAPFRPSSSSSAGTCRRLRGQGSVEAVDKAVIRSYASVSIPLRRIRGGNVCKFGFLEVMMAIFDFLLPLK